MSKKRLRREKARLKALTKTVGQETPSTEESTPKHNVHHTSQKAKGIKGLYENNYKALLLIPFIILFLAMAQIGYQYATTGDFISQGVSLKGGITITIQDVTYDIVELNEFMSSKFSGYDINVRKVSSAGVQTGLLIDADITANEDIRSFIDALEEKLSITSDDYSVEQMGSSLGQSFFKETFIALLLAFLCMGIVVFLYFRIFVPSIAVILAAASDMIVTVAIINIIGIKLSTAGIAAFLMLVGYSVDTDILLSTRVLRRKTGTALDGVYRAMKTGMIMTATTLVAVTIGLFVSESEVLKQIMTILLIGLLIDLINTWIQNAGLLRLYLEKRKNKE